MTFGVNLEVETEVRVPAERISYESLLEALAALRRKRRIVVVSCVFSGLAGAAVFAWLGHQGILRPPLLANAVGVMVLAVDLAGAAVIHVVQGRAVDALRGKLAAQFPGMPTGD